MTVAILLVLIALALSIVMVAAWWIARRPGQSGWTDAIWSFAIGAAGLIAALWPLGHPLDGNAGTPGARQWLVAALVAVWSLRLGLHIALRSAGGNADDPRYKQLREDWGAAFSRRLFGFLQIQAGAAFLLVLSIFVAARNPAPVFAWSDYAGALVLLVAVIGEGVADRQLTAFRRDKSNRGKVCEAGLWSVSRHPNYFFEWLGWCAYAVIAIGPTAGFASGTSSGWPWGWLALTGPAFMYWLLVHASGIPPLEAHMQRSRGKAFEDYQRRVSAFWPLPAKNA